MSFSLPARTLSYFFLKPLLVRILLCCAVLTALLEILALLEEASTILSRHLGISGLLHFSLLHLPTLITEIMPLSVMIGSLLTLLPMTLSSEISVIHAAGLSTLGMYKHILPAPLLIGVITMVIQFWVVPPCEQALNIWWNITATQVNDQDAFPNVWFRQGGNISHIGKVSAGGYTLSDITIYQRRPSDGILLRTEHFPALQATKNGWQAAPNALEISIDSTQTKGRLKNYSGPIPLSATPRQIINMTVANAAYTPSQIWSVLVGESPASLPVSNYLMSFFLGLFLPLQMAVMVLITLPVTYIPPRAGLRNPLPVYVMGAGLGIVILQGMISALGNAGSLPVLLAVCSGQVIAILLSLTWILRMEEK
ncbi:LptF/LptG family permease [Saccharibacter sp. 17.LH.SD]|uniref:LptF/LptG family permease n=1 Tax=Saccharibacter sp. 17.LH.SD TaxID=2689393 RepID=UPI00136C531D|nr:LptF/LptG family permease [Saccharibacter sp. 17.LH.SD]MXV44474.1 LptF/LptG family permease [Saccharibacter sp. 17.LH.SD]